LVSVVLRDGESQRNLSKRFRKAVIRSGVLKEYKKRRWFVSTNERRRLEREKAIRRMNQKRRRSNSY